MTYEINETHDPNLKSWVESANDPDSDFPIQNLPFCFFFDLNDPERYGRVGVVIGDVVLDLEGCIEQEILAPKESTEYLELEGLIRRWSLTLGVKSTNQITI